MTQKLNWTTNDVANTDSHSYRISEIGHTIQVIYSNLPDGVGHAILLLREQARSNGRKTIIINMGQVMSDLPFISTMQILHKGE